MAPNPKGRPEPNRIRVLTVTSAIALGLFVLVVVFSHGLKDAELFNSARYLVLVVCALSVAQTLFLFPKESKADASFNTGLAKFKLAGPPAIAALVVVGSYWLDPKAPPGPQRIFGYVMQSIPSGESPVKEANLQIYGGPATRTTPSGEFSIPKITVQNQPQVAGDPVTFYVDGWVIWDPYVVERGRMYLPKPSTEPIKLRVRRQGDPELLNTTSIEKILAQRTFSFTKTVKPAGPSKRPVTDAKRKVEWAPFLADRAREIGFPQKTLEAAITNWAARADTDYRRGLAALYDSNLDRASQFFGRALANEQGNTQVTVAAAYTAYQSGKYSESARLLETLSSSKDVLSKDPLLTEDLKTLKDSGTDEPQVPPQPTQAPTRPRDTAVNRPPAGLVTIEQKATDVVKLMSSNQVEKVRAMYAADMPARLTAETLRANWNEKIQSFGPFARILSVAKDPSQNVVVIYCAFGSEISNGQVRIEIRFDSTLKEINGLYVKRSTEPRGLPPG